METRARLAPCESLAGVLARACVPRRSGRAEDPAPMVARPLLSRHRVSGPQTVDSGRIDCVPACPHLARSRPDATESCARAEGRRLPVQPAECGVRIESTGLYCRAAVSPRRCRAVAGVVVGLAGLGHCGGFFGLRQLRSLRLVLCILPAGPA